MPSILTSQTGDGGESRRRLIKVCFLVVAVAVVLWKARRLVGIAAPVDDFVEYWAASRLVFTGENPYSTEALLAMQRPLTGSDKPLIMWNPPWALSLLLPFGML